MVARQWRRLNSSETSTSTPNCIETAAQTHTHTHASDIDTPTDLTFGIVHRSARLQRTHDMNTEKNQNMG